MKQALFIPLGFYDYDNKIKQEISDNGYEVEMFNPIGDYTFTEKVWNALLGGRFLKEKSLNLQKEFFSKNLKKYDLIFVIVGRHLRPDLFRTFCDNQPQAKKILYLWDDVKRIENFDEIKDCFDTIFSFDPVDVKKYGFEMLPLFYTESHVYRQEEKKYKFSLIGMLHSERVTLFDNIVQMTGINENECYVYLLGAKASHFMTWFTPFPKRWMGRKYIHAKGMPFEACADILKQTKVALDVQFGSQNGLTLRTLEALAAHTKLITTNQNIRQYDFYNENNICVIDRNHPVVKKEFFETAYENVPDEIVKKYSLAYWVKTMLAFDGK